MSGGRRSSDGYKRAPTRDKSECDMPHINLSKITENADWYNTFSNLIIRRPSQDVAGTLSVMVNDNLREASMVMGNQLGCPSLPSSNVANVKPAYMMVPQTHLKKTMPDWKEPLRAAPVPRIRQVMPSAENVSEKQRSFPSNPQEGIMRMPNPPPRYSGTYPRMFRPCRRDSCLEAQDLDLKAKDSPRRLRESANRMPELNSKERTPKMKNVSLPPKVQTSRIKRDALFPIAQSSGRMRNCEQRSSNVSPKLRASIQTNQELSLPKHESLRQVCDAYLQVGHPSPRFTQSIPITQEFSPALRSATLKASQTSVRPREGAVKQHKSSYKVRESSSYIERNFENRSLPKPQESAHRSRHSSSRTQLSLKKCESWHCESSYRESSSRLAEPPICRPDLASCDATPRSTLKIQELSSELNECSRTSRAYSPKIPEPSMRTHESCSNASRSSSQSSRASEECLPRVKEVSVGRRDVLLRMPASSSQNSEISIRTRKSAPGMAQTIKTQVFPLRRYNSSPRLGETLTKPKTLSRISESSIPRESSIQTLEFSSCDTSPRNFNSTPRIVSDDSTSGLYQSPVESQYSSPRASAYTSNFYESCSIPDDSLSTTLESLTELDESSSQILEWASSLPESPSVVSGSLPRAHKRSVLMLEASTQVGQDSPMLRDSSTICDFPPLPGVPDTEGRNVKAASTGRICNGPIKEVIMNPQANNILLLHATKSANAKDHHDYIILRNASSYSIENELQLFVPPECSSSNDKGLVDLFGYLNLPDIPEPPEEFDEESDEIDDEIDAEEVAAQYEEPEGQLEVFQKEDHKRIHHGRIYGSPYNLEYNLSERVQHDIGILDRRGNLKPHVAKVFSMGQAQLKENMRSELFRRPRNLDTEAKATRSRVDLTELMKSINNDGSFL